MDEFSFALTDSPDPNETRVLEDGLYEYNVAQTQIDEGKLLGIFLSDPRGEVKGGLFGWTWGGVLSVNTLWVHQDVRHRGYGSRLLGMAEREGINRGCHLAILDTYAFQAPDFYRNLGYEVYAVLEDYPTRSKKFFLKKSLRPD